jgi:DNA-binding MarR family transcriptional regulator
VLSNTTDQAVTAATPASLQATGQADGAALIAPLTRVLAEWTAPEFLTAVAAREGVDLDPGAITMITILSHNGPLRPSHLATNMVTGASNISKIVGRLSSAGLVERVADPTDARAQRVQLSTAGHKVAAALVRAGNGLVDQLLDGWPEQDRAEFTRLLAKFEKSTIVLSAQLGNKP